MNQHRRPQAAGLFHGPRGDCSQDDQSWETGDGRQGRKPENAGGNTPVSAKRSIQDSTEGPFIEDGGGDVERQPVPIVIDAVANDDVFHRRRPGINAMRPAS